jgi:cell division protein FtsB
MTSNRPTPLDRMRRYVHSLQEADRPSESYVSVALGDLAAVVTLADVLRADHADPDLGWTTAAIEADLYEQAERVKRRLTVLISTRGTPELQEAANRIYDEEAEKDGAKDWGRAREHLVGDLGQVRAALNLEREISAERLTKIGELKKEIEALKKSRTSADDEAALREDLEDLQNQREDLEEKVKKLEKELREKDAVLEEAVEAARARVTVFLIEGTRMGATTAQNTTLGLLSGLPGIPLAAEPSGEDAEPHCSCGAPKSNHPFRHPFSSKPPNDLPEGTR